jgi:hypothetical protein
VEYPITSYGLPFPQACAKNVKVTLGCSKVFVICLGSLSRNTDVLDRLEVALGKDHFVDVRKGMKPHTVFSEVLEVAVEVKNRARIALLPLVAGVSLMRRNTYHS